MFTKCHSTEFHNKVVSHTIENCAASLVLSTSNTHVFEGSFNAKTILFVGPCVFLGPTTLRSGR